MSLLLLTTGLPTTVKTASDALSAAVVEGTPVITKITLDSYYSSIGTDDGYVNLIAQTQNVGATTMNFGRNINGQEVTSFARFPNIVVGQGGVVSTALLTLYTATLQNGGPTFYISGKDVDNAGTYTAIADIVPTTETNALVTGPTLTVSTSFTVDVTNIVQEIVNRAGWVSGNAIMFYLINTDINSSRTANVNTFEAASNQPLLQLGVAPPIAKTASDSLAASATESIIFPVRTPPLAPQFKGVTSVQVGSSDPAVTSFQVPRLSTLAVGDFMLATVTTNGTAIAAKSGWTDIAYLTTSVNPKARAMYRIADAADVAAATFDFTITSGFGQGIVQVYSGVDTTTPLDFTPVTFDTATSTTTDFTVASATVVTAGTLLVGGAAANTGTVSSNWTSPAGWAETWNPYTYAGGAVQGQGKSHIIGYGLPDQPTGATGTVTWTLSTGRAGSAWMTGLRPAVSTIQKTASDTLSVKVGDNFGPAHFLSHTFENGVSGNAVALSDTVPVGDTSPTSVNTAAATTQTYDSTYAFEGTKSVRWSTTDGVGGAYLKTLGSTPSTGTIYGSFAVRGETMPSALTRLVDARNNAVAYSLGVAWNGTTGKLRFQATGATIADTTITLSLNAWYQVDFRVVPSATVGEFEYRIYDSAGALLETNSYTGLNTGTELSDWRFGYALANSLPTTFNLDAFSLSSVAWQQPKGILTTSTGPVPIAASDTLSASVGDSGTFSTVAVPANDAPTASVTESVATKATVTASDTPTASVGDVGTFATVAIVASDAPAASVTESVATKATVTASDTPTAAVTENRSFGTIPITAADALSASVGDTGTFSPIAIPASDSLAASVSETASVSVVTNLVHDSGFEKDTDNDGLANGFEVYGTLTTTASTQRPGGTGTRSQRIQKVTSGNSDIHTNPLIPVLANTTYNMSIYANVIALSTAQFVYKVEWVDLIATCLDMTISLSHL